MAIVPKIKHYMVDVFADAGDEFSTYVTTLFTYAADEAQAEQYFLSQIGGEDETQYISDVIDVTFDAPRM